MLERLKIAVKRHVFETPPQLTKAERRMKAFFEGSWAHKDVSRREYGSYDEYLEHQIEKLDIIQTRLVSKEDIAFNNFRKRFSDCRELNGIILCLGARLGTEVRALHSLGRFAVGIDLNPGSGNRFVLPGDFHKLQFPDSSIDAVYTNCFDHVFDLQKFTGEIKRVLKPGGYFVNHTVVGYEEGFIAGDYEALFWPKVRPFLQNIADDHGFEMVRCETIEAEPLWVQCVMSPIGASTT